MLRLKAAIWLTGCALLVGGTLLSGCGYTLAGRASNLPEDIEKIFVQTLENDTQRVQVEQILTSAITEELVTRRRFEIVNSAAEADAILQGRVLSFNVQPLTFDNQGQTTNYQIEINVNMKFARPPAPTEEEGEVIWSNSRYRFRQDYPVEEGIAYFDRENIAIEETSEEFARTLVTDLLEGF